MWAALKRRAIGWREAFAMRDARFRWDDDRQEWVKKQQAAR
jgi:hypothetical protein